MADEDAFDGFDEGTPLVATLIGGAALVVIGLATPHVVGMPALRTLVFAMLGLAVAVWAVAFALTIRKSTVPWKAGSLALLLVIAFASATGAFALNRGNFRTDASTIAEMELMPAGALQFPAGARDRGPISRLLVESHQATQNDHRKFAEDSARLGIDALKSPYLLTLHPEILSNCPAIGALKPKLAEVKRKEGERLAAYLKAVDALGEPEDVKHGLRQAMAPAETPEALAALAAKSAENIDATQQMCELLARKTWYNNFAYFGFRNAADMAAFNALVKRLNAIEADLAKANRDGRARVSEGQEIVRAALTRTTTDEIIAALTK
ncbi:hypothetical protein [Sphingomonas sp.]|uniref:hypothetical protein n=1 Tax=Sphingomonas sp. TaxID=28214 RepID=UPI001AFEBFAD|nr:hypothetical protein [Sphingomonas sp.]MBO9713969.1 hypothetical protein [Sphingomonas sp.]